MPTQSSRLATSCLAVWIEGRRGSQRVSGRDGLCLANPDLSGRIGIILLSQYCFQMPILVATLLATLLSIFDSRAALELENLAPPSDRCASSVREKAPEIDRREPPVVRMSGPPLARLTLGAGYRQARDRRGLALCRLSPALDLEGAPRPTGVAGHFPHGSRPDPQDVSREPHLGCSPHPW